MLIDNLFNRFKDKNFFNIDKNTSEVDGVNGSLVIRNNSSLEDKLKAINLSALVGFYSTAIDLPIIKIIDDLEEIDSNDIDVNSFELGIEEINKNHNKKSVYTKMDKLSDLNDLNNGLLIDTDDDFLPDEINAQIIVKELSNNQLISACNIALSLGLNSLGCNLPIVQLYEKGIEENEKVKIYIGKELYALAKNATDNDKFIEEKNIVFDKESNSIFICEDDKDIVSVSDFFASNLQYLIKPDEKTLKDLEKDLEDAMNFKVKQDKEVIFEKEYNFEWEVDEVKSILEKELIPNLSENDKVELDIVVSEEKEIREDLKDYIKEKISQKNAKTEECRVLCSYKQGLSWITEEIIPKIKSDYIKDSIGAIDIKFKPFLPDSKTKWDDEDGATPNINAPREDNPNKYFDLPIRLVQELYPVDDLIEEELGLSRDKVNFKILEDSNYDYEIVVYSNEGNKLICDNFNVYYSERPYLTEFEGIGKVHPNTGHILVKVNDETVIDKCIKTDVEKIWDVYQNEILDECKEYILKETNNNPTADKQPFFDVLKLEILTSEPDYKLNVRQDIISVLSALHEDIYFVGLDFFKTLGLRTSQEVLDEPGLILPIINKRNGQGTQMKVSLEKSKSEENHNIEFDFYINQLYIKDNKIEKVYLDLEAKSDTSSIIEPKSDTFELIENKRDILENKINKENYNFEKLVIKHDNKLMVLENTNLYNPKFNNQIKIEDIDIPQDRVIGYDEYLDIVEKLKQVQNLKVYKASESYQGRDIYAIEILKEYRSSLVSRAKLINNRPVLQINNRHHANEVSSTNSAFLLLEQLLTDEEYKKYLDTVNIVMIPFENVDGGYIHYELQKDNPEWQFHIARFNSVGKEFAREYFKEDSKYTESRALTKLWYKWLPDILTDNHGVPKHEWDQQFSGYTSPWFKGFWLPRALFYGYFWYLEDERYPENKLISEALQDVVSDYVNKDEEITKWNKDWQNRFEKYAHQWMPKLFPANYYKDLIYYWVKAQVNENAWHPSHRYPWITALDWTTEVSDETAQGEYLELCSKTHNLADIATIDLLSKAKFEKNKEVVNRDNEVILKDIRIRPIKV